MADTDPKSNNPLPASIPIPVKSDLDQGIKELEEKYQKEVGAKEGLFSKLEQLEKDQVDIEANIKNREEKIRVLLEKLKIIKVEIENELKRLNELKEADKEIKQDMEEIKKVEEKVKTLEEKLAVLKI